MSTDLFQTGDGTGSSRAFCLLAFDNTDWMLRQFVKALTLMCSPDNWIVQGDQSVDYALNQANIAMEGLIVFPFNPFPAGTVQSYAGANTPDGWLICDGTEYQQADYPELFEAIGQTWGGATGTFFVPDLRGRVTIGVSAAHDLADTGGEETHTLTIGEMPSHVHGYSKPEIPTLVFEPGEVPVSTIDLFPDITGSTGGDEAHNNMQPFAVVQWIIFAAR